LQGLLSSHRVLAFLHASQAAATRFPAATRCAKRMALLKVMLFLRARMGAVATRFLPALACGIVLGETLLEKLGNQWGWVFECPGNLWETVRNRIVQDKENVEPDQCDSVSTASLLNRVVSVHDCRIKESPQVQKKETQFLKRHPEGCALAPSRIADFVREFVRHRPASPAETARLQIGMRRG
jgi:hypothetical protein